MTGEKEFVSRECKIPKSDYKDLEKIKKDSGIPISYHIRTALKQYIKEKKK